MELASIYKAYGLSEHSIATPVDSGLINHTWKITDGNKHFILQRINKHVFPDPAAIHFNITQISAYLKKNHPSYILSTPIKNIAGNDLLEYEDEFYRLFDFIGDSHTIDTVRTADQAYEAAKQFGKFTSYLNGFNVKELKIIIPDFHDLSLRFEQFRSALQDGNQQRIGKSKKIISELMEHNNIVSTYNKIKNSKEFRLRVTHHDTKISNVLYDENDKGLAVIDLDTIMPGYFISDVGDMMRTYLSPANEEEKDTDKIEIRKDHLKAITEGYGHFMEPLLTKAEQESFFYSGKFMIYMQALRFMTDHINNDRYYGVRYDEHNLVRATNQLVLLKRFISSLQSFSIPAMSSKK